jgi:hypothetical protein
MYSLMPAAKASRYSASSGDIPAAIRSATKDPPWPRHS